MLCHALFFHFCRLLAVVCSLLFSQCYADVVVDGFVFRLRLVVDRELSLVPWHPHTSGIFTRSGSGAAASSAAGVVASGGDKRASSLPQQPLVRVSHDPLTAAGHGAEPPSVVRARAVALLGATRGGVGVGSLGGGHAAALAAAAAAATMSASEQALARCWGALAPVPERWRLHLTGENCSSTITSSTDRLRNLATALAKILLPVLQPIRYFGYRRRRHFRTNEIFPLFLPSFFLPSSFLSSNPSCSTSSNHT